MKYVNYEIVFREIPDEVTLAINISNCPHRCVGCHSPYLQQDVGEYLTESSLSELLCKYEKSITCVCFMGGDAAPDEVYALASYIQKKWNGTIKTAWYSGCNTLKNTNFATSFNFIKLGAYVESLGGLSQKTTNQRLYSVEHGHLTDITMQMQR